MRLDPSKVNFLPGLPDIGDSHNCGLSNNQDNNIEELDHVIYPPLQVCY